jgi:hypothetical protein
VEQQLGQSFRQNRRGGAAMNLLDTAGIRRAGLARRLSFWFVLLVMVPMLITAAIIDWKSSTALRERTLLQMTMVAKDKSSSLEIYAYARGSDRGRRQGP